MLLEQCFVNGMLISRLEIVNLGRTDNYKLHSGPHECKYLVKYYSSDGSGTPKFKFTVYHDRLDGHSKLLEQCRKKVCELETSIIDEREE